MRIIKVFGRNPDAAARERYSQLSNYERNRFRNQHETPVMVGNKWSMLVEFIKKPNTVRPSSELPFVKTDLHSLTSATPSVVWFGHSSYLMIMGETRILVDPVFTGSASPFRFLIPAFKGSNSYVPADIPDIDILVLTHDHYDHLDYDTFVALQPRIKQIICPLGVGSHLRYWGTPAEKITEMNWRDSIQLTNDIKFTSEPARHMTGRAFSQFNTLWCSYVLEWGAFRIYIGGDSGFDAHFQDIGKRWGGFDLAFLECGQYNSDWCHVHMIPEETVLAAQQIGAKVLFPVHWSKFALAYHPWAEPIQRIISAANKSNQTLTFPRIGEVWQLGSDPRREVWWDFE